MHFMFFFNLGQVLLKKAESHQSCINSFYLMFAMDLVYFLAFIFISIWLFSFFIYLSDVLDFMIYRCFVDFVPFSILFQVIFKYIYFCLIIFIFFIMFSFFSFMDHLYQLEISHHLCILSYQDVLFMFLVLIFNFYLKYLIYFSMMFKLASTSIQQ